MNFRLLLFLFFTTLGTNAQKEYGINDIETKSSRIQILNISNQQLTELPKGIQNCSKLKKLICKNNSITFLPNWLSQLPKLEYVDFSNNRRLNIKQTISELSQCEKLETLILNRCRMLYIPVVIRKLQNLKTVEFSGNHIKKLPPIFEYVHWEKVDLSYNCIDTLPKSLVFGNSITELDLSFNPAISEKINYYYLSFLKNLQTLKINGATELPDELDKISSIQHLSLTYSEVKSLPESFKSLNKLEVLDIRSSQNLKISDVVEGLKGSYKTLKNLKIGHAGLNTLPFNLYRLKNLKKIIIQNACLNKLNASFKRTKAKEIFIINCSFNQPQLVFNEIAQPQSVQKITVKNCYFAHSNWSLQASDNLKEIHFINCGLNYIPIQPSKFPNLSLINLKGNQIPENKITWESPTTLTDGAFISLKYQSNEVKKWKYKSPKPSIKRMIYTEVGDIFNLPSGTKIEVLPEAFIQTGNKTVDGDVVLEIKEFNTIADFTTSQFPTYTHNMEVSDVKYAIEIKAYHEGKEVFIKHNKPIYVYPQLKSNFALNTLFYHNYKNSWEDLKQSNTSCMVQNNSINIETNCEQYNDIPYMDYQLKASKVYVKIYRKIRKQEWSFLITPEYGYRDEFWDIFGDEIKGYPELKKYHGLKWKYVGDSIDRDLKKLYFLSDQAKEDKLKNKYSLKGYMLDIKDILVFPNPYKDNYLLQFIEGRDTINIEVLPQIPLYEAKKIQRWHKIKYKRYKKALVKRKEKWVKMDTTYLNKYDRFESKLEMYRLSKMDANFIIQNRKNNYSNHKQHVLLIQKPGLYQMSTPLLLSPSEIKKPIFYINNKRFYPKKVLITHLSKGYHYWVNPKEIPKEKGNLMFSVYINGSYYQGLWQKNNIVKFKKVAI